MIIPEVYAPQHHGANSHYIHEKFRFKYNELLTSDNNEQKYHWSQWLHDAFDHHPGPVVLFRPVMSGEDPNGPTPWQVFWGEYAVPLKGTYLLPDRRTAESMLLSTGDDGIVKEITVDFSDVNSIAVCFFAPEKDYPGVEYEMCRLTDYLDLFKHQPLSTTLRPKRTWPLDHPTLDPKDYSIVIVIPPTKSLTCFVVLMRHATLPRDTAAAQAHAANEDA